jgi:hypothetical protein
MCYEGACPVDKVYSTDGTWGIDHGMRLCGGKWGDCWHFNGTCGTGEAFCGIDNCHMGNCTRRPKSYWSTELPWLTGNRTDGLCGGEERLPCNVSLGTAVMTWGSVGLRMRIVVEDGEFYFFL